MEEKLDILNLNELIDEVINEHNKEALEVLIQEFKLKHYPNVISKSKQIQTNFPNDLKQLKVLRMIEAISHAEMEEFRNSREIIKELYEDKSKKNYHDYMLLAELAFMSDYKLARRIMTEAVKQMENQETPDQQNLMKGYLVLGEAEEQLRKFKRAIKYYKRGLSFVKEDTQLDKYMVIYLHFKIGMLYTTLNETDQAISYLQKTNELNDETDKDYSDIKVYSLVAMAKTYASNNEGDKAYPYLIEVLDLLEETSLKNKLPHAEALTELAFYYFNESKLKEAVPYYKQAIKVYQQLPQYPARTVGMIYMQYAYCLEHQENSNKIQAGKAYEKAIECLEKANDPELLENALADVIAFFSVNHNKKKKKHFEEKLVQNIVH